MVPFSFVTAVVPSKTDLCYAAGLGIPVFNAPYANTRSVSELVLAEIIMLARQAGDRSMEVHRGEWNKKSNGCYEVRGKTLGVVGYGHVGSQLSVLAESLGLNVRWGVKGTIGYWIKSVFVFSSTPFFCCSFQVIFYDIEPKLQLGNASQVQTLDELLKTADFVSLHVPLDAGTANLFSAERIAMVRLDRLRNCEPAS